MPSIKADENDKSESKQNLQTMSVNTVNTLGLCKHSIQMAIHISNHFHKSYGLRVTVKIIHNAPKLNLRKMGNYEHENMSN